MPTWINDFVENYASATILSVDLLAWRSTHLGELKANKHSNTYRKGSNLFPLIKIFFPKINEFKSATKNGNGVFELRLNDLLRLFYI